MRFVGKRRREGVYTRASIGAFLFVVTSTALWCDTLALAQVSYNTAQRRRNPSKIKASVTPSRPLRPAYGGVPASQRSANAPDDKAPLVNVDMNVRDRNLGARSESATAGAFVPRLGSEESSVRQVRVKAKALDDRVRFSAIESRSLYSAENSYLRGVAQHGSNSKFLGKERFLFLENNEGFAGRERVDVTLLREGAFKASVFARNTHVDAAYYAPPSAGRDGVASPHVAGGDGFRLRERSGVAIGTELRYGAFALTSSVGRGNVADRIGEHLERRVEHNFTWDMRDDKVLNSILPDGLMRIAPTSLRAGVFDSDADPEILRPRLWSRTKGVVAGAEWDWDGAAFSVDYYRYHSDTVGGPAGPFKSDGSGVSADARVEFAPFTVNAGASYAPGVDSGRGYSAKSANYAAYASLACRPKGLPDLSVEASFGRYGYREVGEDYSAKISSSFRNAVAALDFVKFLRGVGRGDLKQSAARGPFNLTSVKLFYRYDYFSDATLYGAKSPGRSMFGFSVNANLN